MIGIYKITSPSGKIYIGQSKDIEKRFIRYKFLHCKRQPRLYNSFNKYGTNNHIFEIIEECLFENLNTRERYYQEFYDVIGENGLNCVLTETDTLPKVLSEETKQKQSNKSKNRIKSKETCLKLSIALTGRKLSEEHVEKLKNRKHSEETKLKISKANIGRIVSEETRLKRSKLFKGRKCHINTVKSLSKKVINIETNIIYNSVTEAAKLNNLNSSTLSYYLRGNRKNKTNLRYLTVKENKIMENKLVPCTKCLGSGEIMEGRKNSKGFEYHKCTLCKGEGVVDK